MTQYILGIDGGGTKTQAVIVDEQGTLCGSGVSGSSNFDATGIDIARRNLEQAVSVARHKANLTDRPLSAAYLGIAGTVSTADVRVVHDMAQQLALADPTCLGIHHDCRIALAGGLSGRPGIVLIAGTGSSCFGINAAGDSWRAGGWGHLVSDEGSSYWLGVQAMKTAVASYDGRLAPTVLVERVQEYLHIPDLNDIMHRIYVPGLTKTETAALARLVMDAARTGDPVSLSLITQAANDLADCVLAVARKIHLVDASSELAIVGGLLQSGDIFVNQLQTAIAERLPHCRITWPELPPVLGACLLGMQLLHIDIDLAMRDRLQHSASQLATS